MEGARRNYKWWWAAGECPCPAIPLHKTFVFIFFPQRTAQTWRWFTLYIGRNLDLCDALRIYLQAVFRHDAWLSDERPPYKCSVELAPTVAEAVPVATCTVAEAIPVATCTAAEAIPVATCTTAEHTAPDVSGSGDGPDTIDADNAVDVAGSQDGVAHGNPGASATGRCPASASCSSTITTAATMATNKTVSLAVQAAAYLRSSQQDHTASHNDHGSSQLDMWSSQTLNLSGALLAL